MYVHETCHTSPHTAQVVPISRLEHEVFPNDSSTHQDPGGT